MARLTDADIEFDKLVRVGHERAVEELARMPRHMLDRGNPNHPDYDMKLFGYDAYEFMAKQYRKGAI